LGFTNTTPATPSTMIRSPVLMRWAASVTPATAGIPTERARIEVCENLPPRSVMKARTLPSSRRAVAEGSSSSATMIAPGGTSSSSGRQPSTSAASTRRPTSRMSSARSRRYGSGI
jgi:hypothetical protein